MVSVVLKIGAFSLGVQIAVVGDKIRSGTLCIDSYVCGG